MINKELENSMKLPQLDGVPLKVVKQMRPTQVQTQIQRSPSPRVTSGSGKVGESSRGSGGDKNVNTKLKIVQK